MRSLREQRRWTQQDLAGQVGAAASWVSQVEKGTLPPGDKRRAVLETVLGLREGALADDSDPGGDPGGNGATDPEALAFPLLWRARADLVDRLTLKVSSRETRARLYRLSDELLAAAARHPRAGQFTGGGRLQPLRQIAEDAPAWVRRIVLVETAGVKVDAPFHCGISRADQRELLERIAIDLDLSDAYDPVREAFLQLDRPWPKWRELTACGGSAGLVSTLRSEDPSGLRVLLGDDPVAWLGFPFAAGAWLVRDAVRTSATKPLPPQASPSKGLRSGLLAAAAVAAIAGGFGSVLGMSLAPALAGAAVRRAGVQVAPDDGPDPAQGIQTTADVAIALGQYWVRVEAHKIAALYLAFPKEMSEGDGDADLPARADACAHVKRLGDHFAKLVEQEVKASGTRDHDQNEPLRLLIDIHDTLVALGTLLGA